MVHRVQNLEREKNVDHEIPRHNKIGWKRSISVCTGKGKIVRAAFVTHRRALLNRRILIKMYKNFTGFS